MELCKRWTGCVAGLLLAMAGVCWAQESDDGVRRRLLEMKGDDDQAAQVAEMELAAMGEKAVGTLKKIIDDGKDPARAEAMKVYPQALEKAGRLTRVSLAFDNAKMSDVLNGLNRQCESATIEADRVNTKITIHREKVPYCRALAEICQMAEASLNRVYRSENLRFRSDKGNKNRPILEDWGNIVIVNYVSWHNSLSNNGMKPKGPRLELTLDMMMDPAVQPYFPEGFKDVEATDETGKALPPVENNPASIEWSSQGLTQCRQLVLSAPEPVKKIASVKGKMKEFIGYDFETWTLEDAAKAGGSSHEFGPMKMEFRFVELTGSDLTFQALLSGVPRPPGAADADSSRQMINDLISKAMKVESADGHGSWRISSTSMKFIKGNDPISAVVTVTMAFEGGIPVNPVKMKVRMPRKFDEIQVGFEFKDIELF